LNGLNSANNIMDSSIGALLINVAKLKEDLRVWDKWHCKKIACDEHLCRVRSSKMLMLKIKLDMLREECDDLLRLRRLGIK
jgi:hypothetical protein